MRSINQGRLKKILAALTIVILAAIVGQIVSVVAFNQKVYTVKGADKSSKSYLAFAGRKDSTSSWVKRDYDLYGKKVDLQADTIDGTFKNRASRSISSWKMTLHITEDCFINNAWCGKVEIHQFVGTDKEAKQTLDLRNYRLENVKLEYLYDGDLLIPLHKGDYLVYYPSKKDKEVPIEPKSELTMGMIIYHLDAVDMSDYEVEYSYHKGWTEGLGFYAILGLLLLWVVLFAIMLASGISYRAAQEEMKIRMSGISYVSDIYDIIYIINIETDELSVIKADPESEKQRPVNMGARDQLLNLFAVDAENAYVDLMQEFADIRTLDGRLDKQSIVSDYLSKAKGWSRVRFFAMDREPGQPLKKVLCTIRNIEDEKERLAHDSLRVELAESESKSKSVFFDMLTDRVEDSVGSILESTEAIAKDSTEETVRGSAEDIRQEGNLLMSLTEKLKTASAIYAGTLKPEPKEYSFAEMMAEVCAETQPLADEKGIAFETDIPQTIPGKLYGDPVRLRQVISYLTANSIEMTEKGSVTLSVFDKEAEDKAHLLISIKDTGCGIKGSDLKRLLKQWSEEKHNWNFTKEAPGLGLTMIHEMLCLMDSGLHIISTEGEGSEFYFEIDQDIIA